jgi:hypothetical protein
LREASAEQTRRRERSRDDHAILSREGPEVGNYVWRLAASLNLPKRQDASSALPKFLVHCLPQFFVGDVQISLGGLQVCMTQQQLDRA